MSYKQTACPKCDSSDAFTIYEDGAYCFSCQYSTKKVNNMIESQDDVGKCKSERETNILRYLKGTFINMYII